MILDLLEEGDDLPSDLKAELNDRALELYDVITGTQSNEYAEMINSPLQNGIQEQEQLYRQQLERARRGRIYMLIAVIVAAVFLILLLLIIHALTDPLTGIGNRRALDQYLNILSFSAERHMR